MTFTSKLDWSSYIISIAKSASKKIGALIHSLKFLSSEVASYVNKSIIWPCSEYSCHFWAGAPSCLLELLDQIQRQMCRTVGSSLASSLESLSKCSQLKSSMGITLVDVHLNWLNQFNFLILQGGVLVILINSMIFLSPFLQFRTKYFGTQPKFTKFMV